MNAIVLAGGKSKRYGSNKALVDIRGKTLIELIIEKLQKSFSKVYVVGNQEIDYSFLSDVNILKDLIPGKGPLGGLYTGLKFSDSKYNFVVGCDMPNLTQEYFRFLRAQEKNYDVLVPCYNDYIEPLAGIYSCSCLKEMQKSLTEGDLKIKSFYGQVKVEIIKEELIWEVNDPAYLFYNINYKADMKRLRKYFKNAGEISGTISNCKNLEDKRECS